MSDPKAAARAIDALRHGWPVAFVDSGGAALALLAIETADGARAAAFDPDASAAILISAGRAATLMLSNQREAAAPDAPVLVARAPWIGFDSAVAMADPQFDLSKPMKGPFRAIPVRMPDAAAAALRLARIAGILPAFLLSDHAVPTGIDRVTIADIDAHEDADRLVIVTRAQLPVRGAEIAEIVAFRTADGRDDHVALLIGRPDGTPPLVRLHSECLTGDILGSMKCDCGPQLDAAITRIAASGWGILLYLRQEGRGIGLVNKLRAYALQDQGYDTVDANTRLGFAVDARDFRVAARMLTLLRQDRIRLLTNNPEKVTALEAAGITVIARMPHLLPSNPHNARYLATKRDRTGHQL